MAKKEKLTGTKEYHKNPRHITEDRKSELEKNMQELGDISGIVHDLNTDEIISGNQRSKIINLSECDVVITEEFKEPTAQGTVKLGYVIWQDQQFNYRAVKWDENQRQKANITANALTGYWSHEVLANDWGDVNLSEWGFDGKLPSKKDPFMDEPIPDMNQYGVIVMCKGEKEQEEIYKKLMADGLDCKIVVT